MANRAGRKKRIISKEIKEAAIARVQGGEAIKQVAKEIGESYQLVHLWVSSVSGYEKKIIPIDMELRQAAVARVLAGEWPNVVAEEVGLRVKTLRHWVENVRAAAGIKVRPIYPRSVRETAIARVLTGGESLIKVSEETGIAAATFRRWITEARREAARKANGDLKDAEVEAGRVVAGKGSARKLYSKKERAGVVKLASEKGGAFVTKETGIAPSTLLVWAREAKVEIRTMRQGPRVEEDVEFTWVSKDCPHLEEWRDLAARWMKEQNASMRQRVLSVRTFIKDYLDGMLHKMGLPTAPAAVLSRSNLLPDFFGSCLKHLSHVHATVQNNYVHNFLEWVLLINCSMPDDHGRPIVSPAFHNIVPERYRKGRSDSPIESVRSPLPYGYIDELRKMIAEGPNFIDWKWARGALDNADEYGTGRAGPEWFEVDRERIDLKDPDCVWRERVTKRGRVIEMWSPVRWVAVLIKLQLPARTVQVRLVDSGEADTWRYERTGERIEWVRNPNPLSIGTERKPRRQGVLRRPGSLQSLPGQKGPSVVLYFNTNKTADAMKAGEEKGLETPWPAFSALHGNPFHWLEKLRNWQEKYNPVRKLTSWSELTSKHVDLKSEVQLAGFSDACFLFRVPEDGPLEAHLPLAESYLDRPWYVLLQSFQERLAARGEMHADASPVILVDPDSITTTYFPRHSMRVSLITAFALEGLVPFPIMQKVVGHSRLLMLLYYVKPGQNHILDQLDVAARKLDEKKAQSIVNWLRNTEYGKLVENAIANSTTTILTVIPIHPASRNAAGWMPMHHGLCLVGGNTSKVEGNAQIGGCYNGGPNIGNDSNPRHAPVPGGSRNCVRCRWFVTRPEYLPALVAHINNIFYHYGEAQSDCLAADRRLGELKRERAAAEEAAELFLGLSALKDAERTLETAMKRFSDLAEDAAACSRLIYRCIELQGDNEVGDGALIAVGSSQDLKVAVEEVDSELLQLSGICEDAELYPDLHPGKAVFRRSQLLEAALMREGLPPVFMMLSEDDQLRIGNIFMRRLAVLFSPENPAIGRRQIVALMDAKKKLSEHLGLDLDSVLDSLVPEVAKEGKVRSLGSKLFAGETDE